MYNFKRLIKKYSKYPVEKIELKGKYDYEQGGVWVEEEVVTETLEDSAVVPLNNQDLQFDENGTYGREDRKLYTYYEVKKGDKIRHKDLEYTVHEKRDYGDFDVDLNIYFIKRSDLK